MPWLTPDDAIGSLRAYRVFVPYNLDMESAYKGALLDLARVENWQQWGATTEEECAEAWELANILNLEMRPILPTGTVIWGAYSNVPDGYLACDGAQYNVADYQELHNAIGYAWGGSGTVFNVPDLVDRVPVGVGGDFSLADAGGEKTVALSEAQVPSHFHTIPSVSFVPVQSGAGAFALGVFPTGNYYTNTSGGGGSHTNLQPYVALTPIISYR